MGLSVVGTYFRPLCVPGNYKVTLDSARMVMLFVQFGNRTKVCPKRRHSPDDSPIAVPFQWLLQANCGDQDGLEVHYERAAETVDGRPDGFEQTLSD